MMFMSLAYTNNTHPGNYDYFLLGKNKLVSASDEPRKLRNNLKMKCNFYYNFHYRVTDVSV